MSRLALYSNCAFPSPPPRPAQVLEKSSLQDAVKSRRANTASSWRAFRWNESSLSSLAAVGFDTRRILGGTGWRLEVRYFGASGARLFGAGLATVIVPRSAWPIVFGVAGLAMLGIVDYWDPAMC